MGDLKSLFYFHLLATLTSYLSTVTFKVFVNSDDKLFNILLPDNGWLLDVSINLHWVEFAPIHQAKGYSLHTILPCY